MNVLVLNSGSSTIKFQLIRSDREARLLKGLVDLAQNPTRVDWAETGKPPEIFTIRSKNYRFILDVIVKRILKDRGVAIHAVGHRVVHGGETLTTSSRITTAVTREIRRCSSLAPLHNPANLQGILAARAVLGPRLPQVAVFDTAFHSTLPEHAYLYGIPYRLYRKNGFRRYGFHGTSHQFVMERYAELTRKPLRSVNLITLHLGSGASACAIRSGKSIDTTMGYSPLEGLMMATRAGDLDASVALRLGTASSTEHLLNHRSGLLGVSEISGDMRVLLKKEKSGSRSGKRAINLFCYRAAKAVGAYSALLPSDAALVFTAGIGENSAEIRKRICSMVPGLGIRLDPGTNRRRIGGRSGKISSPRSGMDVLVIPTDEELLIARDTAQLAL